MNIIERSDPHPSLGIREWKSWEKVRVLMVRPHWDAVTPNMNAGKTVRRLLDRGAEVTLFCQDGPGLDSLPAPFNQMRVVTIRPGGSRVWKYRTIARHHDIVLWTYSGYHENLLMAAHRLLGGPRYVIKIDSKLFYKVNSARRLASNLLYFLLPGLAADRIVVESPALAVSVHRVFGDKTYFLPNGAPVAQLFQWRQEFEKERSPGRRPYILYVGMADSVQGIDILIRIFAKVAAVLPDWTLEIVALPSPAVELAKIHSLVQEFHLENRVIFHPPSYGRELMRWYHFAEMFVLPSRRAGLPNRIPEAMFFRNPVVAFDIGQIRSMVSPDVGVLIPPGDINAFAEAVLSLARDGELRLRLGEAACSMIESSYDDDVLLSRFLDAMRDLVRIP